MNLKKLNNFLKEKSIPKFRLRQIIKAVYGDGVFSFGEIDVLPKSLREDLDKNIGLFSFEVVDVLKNKKFDTFKAKIKLRDGFCIESVLLANEKNKFSVCVSSQVGCAMACEFCATGSMGFKRNLDYEEILDQVLYWRAFARKNNLNKTISNIVFMGMGEPFNNYDEVAKAIRKLQDEELFNFSARHISVSTSGVVPGIKKFAKDFPQSNLAISIIAPNNILRSSLMPVNNAYNLEDIKRALDYYFKINNRKVFFEYIMFDGVNDTIKHAEELSIYVKSFLRPDLIHINLIIYNETGTKFRASSRENIQKFKNYLSRKQLSVSIRKSYGNEIQGACGQLATTPFKS